MDIAYAFFAESAQVVPDGRLNLLGADTQTWSFAGQPPWVLGTFFLVTAVRFDVDEWKRPVHFLADLITPAGERIDPHIEHDFDAPVPEHPELNPTCKVLIHLNGLTFPGPGIYQMKITFED